jgi:uncharacterized membrane protein YccC
MSTTPAPEPANDVAAALRVAIASAICVVISETLRLDFAYLSVMSVNMVMAQYTHTIFQKGVERILGRALGIAYGLILVSLFHDASVVGVILKILGLLAFFYIHFSGRMVYTFLQAGLYLAVIVEIGHAEPLRVYPAARDIFLEITLGVVVASSVIWLAGAEQSLSLELGGPSLFPVRAAWLSHSAMLAVTVLVTQFITRSIGLPVEQALVSVMMLTTTTDQQALVRKGRQRLAGALLAGLWGLLSWSLLARLPYLPLLVGLVFLGMFLAAYHTRVGGAHSYVGLQTGLVIPLVLLVPVANFGSLAPAEVRLVGIAIGLFTSVVISELWPTFPAAPQVVDTDVGEMAETDAGEA